MLKKTKVDWAETDMLMFGRFSAWELALTQTTLSLYRDLIKATFQERKQRLSYLYSRNTGLLLCSLNFRVTSGGGIIFFRPNWSIERAISLHVQWFPVTSKEGITWKLETSLNSDAHFQCDFSSWAFVFWLGAFASKKSHPGNYNRSIIIDTLNCCCLFM